MPVSLIFAVWILICGLLTGPSIASGGRVPEVSGAVWLWSGRGGQGADAGEDLVEQVVFGG